MLILLNYFWFNLIHDRLLSGNGMDSVDYEARFLILKEDRQDGICRYLNFLDPVSFVFEWILSDELFFVLESGPAFWVLPSGWNHPQSEMGFKVSPSQQGIRLIPHWVHCSCPWTHTVCDDMPQCSHKPRPAWQFGSLCDWFISFFESVIEIY